MIEGEVNMIAVTRMGDGLIYRPRKTLSDSVDVIWLDGGGRGRVKPDNILEIRERDFVKDEMKFNREEAKQVEVKERPILAERDERFDYLDEWQYKAATKLARQRGGILFAKPGEGKTRTALATFQMLHDEFNYPSPVVLIICRKMAMDDWQKEVESLFGWKVFRDMENLQRCKTPYIPKAILLSEAMVDKQLATFQHNSLIKFIIIDEGWMFKNPKALRSKAVYKLTKDKNCMLLSGTLMTAKNLEDIWGMMKAVQRHKEMSPTLTKLRTDFFLSDISKWNPNLRVYRPKRGTRTRFLECLEPYTVFRFPKDEERKIRSIVQTVKPTKEQTKLFHELRKYYSIEDNKIELSNPLQVTNKIQSIANGWYNDNEGKSYIVPTKKYDKLLEILTSIREAGEKAVVWCNFKNDVDFLQGKLPFKTAAMYSKKPFDLEGWAGGKYDLCLATVASGVSFNHFENVPYAIYYSHSYKALEMQQSMGRTNRRSSVHSTCYYYYLQVETSLDERIYRAVMSSSKNEESFLRTASLTEWLEEE